MSALESEPDQVERHLEEALAAEADAEHYLMLAEARRRDAARHRAAIDRLVNHTGVTVKAQPDPLAKARRDPLLGAAGVAVESLPRGFKPSDLLDVLAITDTARAERLCMALADMGKLARYEHGWTVLDGDETLVRDWIVQVRSFTFGQAMEALSVEESSLAAYLDDFRERGIVTGAGGHYEYVEALGKTGARPRRRPPELDPPAGTDAPRRGEPVRLQDHAQRAKQGSVPGQRHKLVMRDRRYEAMQAAKAERAEKNQKREAHRKQK